MSNGIRTRDILDHNQVLYRLSYTHHAAACPRRHDKSSGTSGAGEIGSSAYSAVSGSSGTAPVSEPWCRRAMTRESAVEGPGGATNTASR